MKILVVGDGHSALHEVAVVAAFSQLGHEVEPFYWHTYFKSSNPLVRLWRRAQNKFLVGPTINRLNHDLLKKTFEYVPELIFIYRGTHITARTLIDLKQTLSDCKIFGYNNDDPFADGHPPWLWRHYIKCVPIYDVVFAYRHRNLVELKKIGAKKVDLLRSWFIPELNHPVPLSVDDVLKYECDVVFIGHYENDGRLQYLEEIVNQGYKLRIFGPPHEWNKILLKSELLKSVSPVRLIWNIEYSKALCGAKIALCFFSKLNRDTYTRRCFEIPATGTMLLSEYSEDMSSLYTVGKEADFFKSKNELIIKLERYLKDDKLRQRVANGGYQRVIKDGHDIVSRMEKVIEQLEVGNNVKERTC